MAEIQVTRSGISFRVGGIDTPAPEGAVSPPPRIVVAVSPVDPRTRVTVVLRAGGRERSIALRAARRTREEQFFEGSFSELRGGDQVEYFVAIELARDGGALRFDSSEVPGGLRRFELVGGAPRRRDIVTTPALGTRLPPSPGKFSAGRPMPQPNIATSLRDKAIVKPGEQPQTVAVPDNSAEETIDLAVSPGPNVLSVTGTIRSNVWTSLQGHPDPAVQADGQAAN